MLVHSQSFKCPLGKQPLFTKPPSTARGHNLLPCQITGNYLVRVSGVSGEPVIYLALFVVHYLALPEGR